jgi:hypothetical protein
MRTMTTMAAVIALLAVVGLAQPRHDPALQKLGDDVFAWRLQYQPFTYDDVDRLERPADWVPDWSPAALAKGDEALKSFEQRLAAIDPKKLSKGDQIDYLLLRSELDKADFDRHVIASPSRDPDFYIAQSVGVVYNQLVRPTPFDAARAAVIIRLLGQVPQVVEAAKINLTAPIGPMADRALAHLKNVSGKCDRLAETLGRRFPASEREKLRAAAAAAGQALEGYATWLQSRRAGMGPLVPVGKEKYNWLLRRVLMLPFSSDQLVTMATQERCRAEVFEAYEQQRRGAGAVLAIVPTIDQELNLAVKADDKIRQFLVSKHILQVPDWTPHFRFLQLPDYLAAFNYGAEIYMFSPSYPREDFVRYVQPPTPNLGFWSRILATDPSPVVVHEGIPGHAFHLRAIDTQPDQIRRRHYDGAVVEGWGTYVEEMLLQQGLFDEPPALRRVVYQMMKLRTLRMLLDVNVSTGAFSIEQGATFLSENVPMDYTTAFEEANWAAAQPLQNVGYFAGKAAIMRFLAEARHAQGDTFDLFDFHTRMVNAGGVPVSLLRWEWLGQDDDVRGLW